MRDYVSVCPRLRLRLFPTRVLHPARQTRGRMPSPAMQPFFNAFPLPNPNSPEIPCDPNTDPYCPSSGESGLAALNASFSNRSTLDAASLRVDHRLNDKMTLFGRYNYAPSELVQRGFGGLALNGLDAIRVPTQTVTLGVTWIATPRLTNDFRANYSRVNSTSAYSLDNFGGAVPFVPSLAGLPSPYTAQNSQVSISVFSFSGSLYAGNGSTAQTQRQFNAVDSLSLQMHSHTLKFGVDYRRLTPSVANPAYIQTAAFFNVSEMQSGALYYAAVSASSRVPLILQNLGLFAQDTWRAGPRLTLTYGLRWDIDFRPKTSSGPSLPAVVNFNDLSTLALAPPGTPVFNTRYGNIAPRIGIAYQLFQKSGWESVLRGGWGLFNDLSTTQLQVAGGSYYPFGSANIMFGGQFPLNPNCSFDPVNCPNSSQPIPVSSANAVIYA